MPVQKPTPASCMNGQANLLRPWSPTFREGNTNTILFQEIVCGPNDLIYIKRLHKESGQ